MQDELTGRMIPLVKQHGRLVRKDDGTLPPLDAPLFRVGELVQLKGGWFRVHGIRPKKLILKGVAQKAALAELKEAAQ